MTRLGIGSYALAWSIGVSGYPKPKDPMDALAFVRYCAGLGVGLVQMADNLPLDVLNDSELSKLLAEIQQLGLAVEVGTRGIEPDHLRGYLELALKFGSPILRTVIDTATHHPAPEEVIKTLKVMIPEFKEANVTLAIENHDRFKAKTLASIVEKLGSSYVGVCLDTVNSFGALEGPEVVVETLGPYVVNLHVKDFSIQRADHNMGFIVKGSPAGSGMLDIPWLLAELDHHKRRYNAILELWPAPENDMAATCDKEQRWVAQSIDYLRTLIKD